MENLFEQSSTIIGLTSTDYIRNLMDTIEWDYRLIAIRGARGIGYIVADDIEFGLHQKIPLWLFGFLY